MALFQLEMEIKFIFFDSIFVQKLCLSGRRKYAVHTGWPRKV